MKDSNKVLVHVLSYYRLKYSTAVPWSPEEYYNNLMKFLGEISGKRVLDVGFGYGEMLRVILKNGGEGYGIEIVKEAIEYAKRVAPKAVVVLAFAENMPFKDSFFDVVLCSGTIEHFIDRDTGLQEVHRVMKKGGFLVAVVPNRNWLGKLHKWFGLSYIKRILYKLLPRQPIERELSLKQWLDILRKNGFTTKQWEPYNIDLKFPILKSMVIQADQIPPALCYHFVIKARR